MARKVKAATEPRAKRGKAKAERCSAKRAGAPESTPFKFDDDSTPMSLKAIGTHNTSLMAQASAAKQLIFSNDLMSDLAISNPLKIVKSDDINESGHAEPYNAKTAATSLRSTGLHDCAINYFWLDEAYWITPEVPVCKKLISEFIDATFPAGSVPGVPSWRIDVLCVDIGNVESSKGSWKSITSPQVRLAPLLACARDVQAGCDDDQLKAWRRLFLTTSVRIMVEPDTSLWRFKSLNTQIEIQNVGESATATALQKVMELGKFKEHLEQQSSTAMSVTQVFQEYNRHVQQVCIKEDSELKTSENLVEHALTVYQRMFSLPRAFHALMREQETYGKGGLFNHLSKMYAVVQRSRGEPAKIIFATELLCEWFDDGALSGGCSVRDLLGDSKSGKRGLVDVAMFLYELKEHALEHWLKTLKIDFDTMALIRDSCNNPAVNRTLTNVENEVELPGDHPMRKLDAIGKILFEGLSDILFSPGTQQRTEAAMKQRLTASDVFEGEKIYTVFFESLNDALGAAESDQPATEKSLQSESLPEPASNEDPTAGITKFLSEEQQKIAKTLSDEQTTVLTRKKAAARQLVLSRISLISEQKKSAVVIAKLVLETPAGKFEPHVDFNGGKKTETILEIRFKRV